MDRSWLPRVCETTLDASVVVLATWTVVYHACLLLRLAVPWAVGLQLGAMTVSLLGWWWSHRRSAGGARRPALDATPTRRTAVSDGSSGRKAVLAMIVVAATAAAALVAIGGDWRLVSGLWLFVAVAGTVLAVLDARGGPGTDPAEDREDPDRGHSASGGAVLALAWATVLAALSMFARLPNPDDLYYINLSQWVVDHGTFPLRDTIFSDLVFPMSNWPPIASYDALAGTLAWLSGVPAASVVYLVVPPVATFLSVLALWRLLREWRVRLVGIALSVALAFLLFDGGPGYAAPGSLFLTRIWQGKAILLCLLVPTLLVYASRYVARPSTARAGWLCAGGVAAVGLTTSAMFLVPLIALAGVTPLVARRPGRALIGFAAMAAYPLAMGAVTLLVGGHSADLFDTRRLFRFDPAWFGPEIFGDGPLAFIAVAAVLAGVLIAPLVGTRVTIGVLVIILGVTFVPGVTRVSFDLVGLGPTLWRVSWIVPIAGLVGVFGVQLGSYGNQRGLMVATPVVVAVVLAVSGLPIWSESLGTSLDSRPQWKRHPDDVEIARRLIDAARPGDLILAADNLPVTITVMTTRVKTVAPRGYYMDYLRDDPRFHYAERKALLRFANGATGYTDTPQVARALTVLDVDLVCLPTGSHQRFAFLRGEGYQPVMGSTAHTCLRRG